MKLADGPLRIVLGGLGPACSETAVHAAGAALADRLALPGRTLVAPEDPEASLASLLAEPEPGSGWLAPLPVDLGRPLAVGGSWAEALGAWRQPTLLLLPAEQVGSGLPAAAWALLRQWQVPMLGLVQLGGIWEPGQRRRDGLPWLGALAAEEGDADAGPDGGGEESLALGLRLAWRRLEIEVGEERG